MVAVTGAPTILCANNVEFPPEQIVAGVAVAVVIAGFEFTVTVAVAVVEHPLVLSVPVTV